MKKLEDIILETMKFLDEKDVTGDEINSQSKTTFHPPKEKNTLKGNRSDEIEEENEEEIDLKKKEDKEEDEDDTIINFKNSTNYLHFKDFAVNQFRAGKSLDSNDEVEEYFNRLPKEYKRFFFFVFRVLTQITDGVSGNKAPLPDKYFDLKSKFSKSEKIDSEKRSKELAPDMVKAKPSKNDAPIVVGESQDKSKVLEILQRING